MKNSFILSLAIIFLFGTACKDDASNDPVDPSAGISTFKGTQSPGDVWDWTLNSNDNTFTCVWDHGSFDDESDDITVQGTYTVLPSGFLECTINGVAPSTPDIPADGTAWFYAMHLPDMAMVIKPEGSIKGDIIAAVAAGDCSDVVGDYNYFNIAPGNGEKYDPNTEEAYGRATFLDNGDGTYEIHGDKYSLDCANGGPCTVDTGIQDSPAAVCTENGAIVISSSGSTVTEGQFTKSGVMMLDKGEGNGGVLALSKANAFEFDDLDGLEFVGLAYLPANNDNKTVPVHLSFEDDGQTIIGTGTKIENINTGALEADESVSMRFDSNDQGLMLGQMTHGDGKSTYFVASFLSSEGKKIIVLSSTSSPDNDPFILVVASK